jgi:hypothetical protein
MTWADLLELSAECESLGDFRRQLRLRALRERQARAARAEVFELCRHPAPNAREQRALLDVMTALGGHADQDD